jgi:hypothetical protein
MPLGIWVVVPLGQLYKGASVWMQFGGTFMPSMSQQSKNGESFPHWGNIGVGGQVFDRTGVGGTQPHWPLTQTAGLCGLKQLETQPKPAGP